MGDELVFFVNGKKVVERYPDPTVTLLQYLRRTLRLPGTKDGCGQGGCGACSVMISSWDQQQDKVVHYCVNACITPICSLHGRAVTTVEGVGSTRNGLHPIQKRLVENHGIQCGFCSPGMVMSMYTLLRNKPTPSKADIERSLEGNLCRCTGYRPILDAFKTFTKECPRGDQCCMNRDTCTPCANDCGDYCPNDVTQDPIFPPELKTSSNLHSSKTFCCGNWTWHRPTSLAEMAEIKSENPSAVVVMGATIHIFKLKSGNMKEGVIISGACVPELRCSEVTDSGLKIGAAVTLSELETVLRDAVKCLPEQKTRAFVAMLDTLQWLAADQIRNVATVGGNIMAASSLSDLNPILLATTATVTAASKGKTVELHSYEMDQKFFPEGGKTRLKPEEILVSVTIPYTSMDEYVCSFKQTERRGFDSAVVNAAICVRLTGDSPSVKNLRIVVGGIAPHTVIASKTTESVRNMPWNSETISRISDCLLPELSQLFCPTFGLLHYRLALVCGFFLKFYMDVETKLHRTDISNPPSTAVRLSPDPCEGTQMFEALNALQPKDDPVGRPVPILHGEQLASGEARFIDDMPAYEDELFVVNVTSSIPHGRILEVDPSRALTLPGVVDYIDYRDVPGDNQWNDDTTEDIFACKEVRCCGHVIGGIVADTREHAQEAAKQVNIRYEELPAVLSIQDAIQQNSFYPGKQVLMKGDVEAGFRKSDHVIEGEMSIGGQEHFYMEPQAVLVVPKKEHGEVEIYSQTQEPAKMQTGVAKAIGTQRNKVVVKVKRAGGAFGGRQGCAVVVWGPAVIAANKLQRPVRAVLSRFEDIVMTGKRHPFYAKYKVGVTKDGKLQALDVALYVSGGHKISCSNFIVLLGMMRIDNGYQIPNCLITGHLCKTNVPSNTAFRGFAGPQASMIMDNILWDIALKLQVTPEQVRETNLYKEGDLTHYNQKVTNCTLQECWNQCKHQSEFELRREKISEYNRENKWKKRGIAMTASKCMIGAPSNPISQATALVNVYTDGSVLIAIGGIEMGQGLYTKCVQVASRVLSISRDKVYISETSTHTIPNATETGGSISSDFYGGAIINACNELNERLVPVKKANPTGTWEEWIQAAYMDRISLSVTGFFRTREEDYDVVNNTGMACDYFTYGVACTEVEIDILTGEQQMLRTDIVMDVGQSLNPGIDIGQIEGAFIQGYGLVTTECLKMTKDGHIFKPGPQGYKIPTVRNIPRVFKVTLLKDSKNTGERAVYSSKGIGEPPILLCGSVFYAIKQAISAARTDAGLSGNFRLDCPATMDRIRLACSDEIVSKCAMAGKDIPVYVTM